MCLHLRQISSLQITWLYQFYLIIFLGCNLSYHPDNLTKGRKIRIQSFTSANSQAYLRWHRKLQHILPFSCCHINGITWKELPFRNMKCLTYKQVSESKEDGLWSNITMTLALQWLSFLPQLPRVGESPTISRVVYNVLSNEELTSHSWTSI